MLHVLGGPLGCQLENSSWRPFLFAPRVGPSARVLCAIPVLIGPEKIWPVTKMRTRGALSATCTRILALCAGSSLSQLISAENGFHDLAVDIGESVPSALKLVGEGFMIHSQLIQNGGLQIMDVHAVSDDIVA